MSKKLHAALVGAMVQELEEFMDYNEVIFDPVGHCFVFPITHKQRDSEVGKDAIAEFTLAHIAALHYHIEAMIDDLKASPPKLPSKVVVSRHQSRHQTKLVLSRTIGASLVGALHKARAGYAN